MFAALFSPDSKDAAALLAAAQACSPRVEPQLGGRLVLIDTAGLTRIVGDAAAIAEELSRAARRTPHVTVSVAVAPSRTAALLLAIAQPYSVVLPGRTAAAVGALSLEVFDTLAANKGPGAFLPPRLQKKGSRPLVRACALCRLAGAPGRCGEPGGACTELATLRRWGLATLGDLAALPAADLAARLGQAGVVLQRFARGLDTQPLVPVLDEARFEASLDLEWPLDALQPVSFVLTRLLDPLSAALERADRGAAVLETTLTLVTARVDADGTKTRETHVRRIELPAPMREARVLRTLILLDLESHPPPAGIDRIAVRLEPAPGRIVQFSLLERAGTQPETIATVVSRLTALMGEGRVGSPVLLDSHAPDAFTLAPFAPAEARSANRGAGCAEARSAKARPVLRRFRIPVVARVALEGERVARVTTDRIGIRGGAVEQCAGPWRSSGGWWSGRDPGACWDRDEYDVTLADGAAYRICRDRHEDRWFVEGILD